MNTDTKGRQWDVRTDDGDLVTDLDTLATVLGTNRTAAALTLLNGPGYKAAPAQLVHEVNAELEVKDGGRPKPGGGTPPPIDSGSFVQWGSNRGRVDLIVTNGKVPGVEEDVEGSKDSPAVRVVVWEKDGDGYKPGRKKIGKMAHTLKRIAPLNRGKAAAAAGDDLVALLAEHEARGLPSHAQVTGTAVKKVFERGLEAWPGYERTELSRRQWATGRVKAFLAAAAGDDPHGYHPDLGMLAKAHPRHPQHRPADWVVVDPAEIAAAEALFTDA